MCSSDLGDRARLRADGSVELFGRESVTINTGGEKVFAEEVEQAIKTHDSIWDVVVVGRPSTKWGQEVVAVVVARADVTSRPSDDELREVCAAKIARYKLPKEFVWVDEIKRTAAGKPNYAWVEQAALRASSAGSALSRQSATVARPHTRPGGGEQK